MPGHNIAAKSKEEQDKVNVDLAASGVAFKEWLEQFVPIEEVVSMQPSNLQDFFKERLSIYRDKLPQKRQWESGFPPRGLPVLAYVNRVFELAMYKSEGWFYLDDGRFDKKAEVDPKYWMTLPPYPSR